MRSPISASLPNRELRPNAPEDSAKFKSRWLRCRVANKLSSTSQIQLPEVNTIRLSVNPTKPFPAELAFNNDIPLNLEEVSLRHGANEERRFESRPGQSSATREKGLWRHDKPGKLVVRDILKLDNSFDEPEIFTVTRSGGIVTVDREVQYQYKADATSTVTLLTALRPGDKNFTVPSLEGLEIEQGNKVDLFHPSEDPERIEIQDVKTDDKTKLSEITLSKQATKFYMAGDRVKILPKIKPFGELPALFDTFYIASDEAFSKKGAVITLNVDSKWNDIIRQKIRTLHRPLFSLGNIGTARVGEGYE